MLGSLFKRLNEKTDAIPGNSYVVSDSQKFLHALVFTPAQQAVRAQQEKQGSAEVTCSHRKGGKPFFTIDTDEGVKILEIGYYAAQQPLDYLGLTPKTTSAPATERKAVPA